MAGYDFAEEFASPPLLFYQCCTQTHRFWILTRAAGGGSSEAGDKGDFERLSTNSLWHPGWVSGAERERRSRVFTGELR